MVCAALRVSLPALGRNRACAASLWSCGQALEPWLVLGEQSGPGGTTRTVDSSLERMQVLVAGRQRRSLHRDVQRPIAAAHLHGPRRANGRRGPLSRLARRRGLPPHHSAARASDVRHLDTWIGRSIGGCRYHVAHPADAIFRSCRSTRSRPRADGWRASRPWAIRRAATPEGRGVHPDFPLTLDLRHCAQAAD